jgi:hypothetical protein
MRGEVHGNFYEKKIKDQQITCLIFVLKADLIRLCSRLREMLLMP